MRAVKTVVRDEAAEQRLRAERAEARLAIAEARAAYWCAEYTVATNAPRSRAAKEASVASDEAQARLKALGVEP